MKSLGFNPQFAHFMIRQSGGLSTSLNVNALAKPAFGNNRRKNTFLPLCNMINFLKSYFNFTDL